MQMSKCSAKNMSLEIQLLGNVNIVNAEKAIFVTHTTRAGENKLNPTSEKLMQVIFNKVKKL